MEYKLIVGSHELFIEKLNQASLEGWHPAGAHTAVFIKDPPLNNFVQYSMLMMRMSDETAKDITNRIVNAIVGENDGAYKN